MKKQGKTDWTNIKIPRETRNKLNLLKAQYKFKTLDETMNYLLSFVKKLIKDYGRSKGLK